MYKLSWSWRTKLVLLFVGIFIASLIIQTFYIFPYIYGQEIDVKTLSEAVKTNVLVRQLLKIDAMLFLITLLITLFFGRQITTTQRQAEKELQKREEFNWALFNYSPIETIVVDLEGRVVKSNLAKRKFGGRLPNIGDVMYKNYAGKHKIDMHAELMKCIQLNRPKKFPKQKYNDKILSIIIAPFSDGAIITSKDITERKQTEETLQKSELRFRMLFESMSEGVCLHELIYNDNRDVIDYRIIDINPKFEKILGFKKEKILNKLASEAYGISKPPFLETYKDVVQSGEPVQFETYFFPLNKHFLISAFSPGKDQFATIFEDITERKQAEEVLRANEDRYRQIFRFSPDSIIIHDIDMNIVAVNNKAVEEFGYSKEELLKKTVFELHPETELKHSDQVLAGMKKKDMIMVETDFVRKDGSIFRAEATPCKYTLGSKLIIHVVIRDITERKKAKNALLKERDFAESIINTSQAIVLVLDIEGKIIRFNKYMEDLSGYSLNEVRGKDWFITFLPEEEHLKIREMFLKSVDDIQTKGNVNTIITKDGSQRDHCRRHGPASPSPLSTERH